MPHPNKKNAPVSKASAKKEKAKFDESIFTDNQLQVIAESAGAAAAKVITQNGFAGAQKAQPSSPGNVVSGPDSLQDILGTLHVALSSLEQSTVDLIEKIDPVLLGETAPESDDGEEVFASADHSSYIARALDMSIARINQLRSRVEYIKSRVQL